MNSSKSSSESNSERPCTDGTANTRLNVSTIRCDKSPLPCTKTLMDESPNTSLKYRDPMATKISPLVSELNRLIEECYKLEIHPNFFTCYTFGVPKLVCEFYPLSYCDGEKDAIDSMAQRCPVTPKDIIENGKRFQN